MCFLAEVREARRWILRAHVVQSKSRLEGRNDQLRAKREQKEAVGYESVGDDEG